MTEIESAKRTHLKRLKRVVVKIGTRVLVTDSGRISAVKIKSLVDQIASLRKANTEVVLVSSGAIGAGLEALAMKRRPQGLADLQMVAAVGQCRLMSKYSELFGKHRLKVAQVLLTHDDLRHRARHLNARNTLLNLLRHGIVPVINENDVISVDEIKFGDNDQLAALTVLLVGADGLILLSTTDGLRQIRAGKLGSRISYVPTVTPEILALAQGKGGELSSGGMKSKLLAAKSIAESGASVVIADGRKPEVLKGIINGENIGTLIGGEASQGLRGKKRWIAHFNRPQGALIVDDGAVQAIRTRGNSLLPIGVRSVEGEFPMGAVVSVKSIAGETVATGLVSYESGDIRAIMGHRSSQIEKILGARHYEEVIHRDNLVVSK